MVPIIDTGGADEKKWHKQKTAHTSSVLVVVDLYYSTSRVLNIISFKLNAVKTTQKLGLLHSLYIGA